MCFLSKGTLTMVLNPASMLKQWALKGSWLKNGGLNWDFFKNLPSPYPKTGDAQSKNLIPNN